LMVPANQMPGKLDIFSTADTIIAVFRADGTGILALDILCSMSTVCIVIQVPIAMALAYKACQMVAAPAANACIVIDPVELPVLIVLLMAVAQICILILLDESAY